MFSDVTYPPYIPTRIKDGKSVVCDANRLEGQTWDVTAEMKFRDMKAVGSYLPSDCTKVPCLSSSCPSRRALESPVGLVPYLPAM